MAAPVRVRFAPSPTGFLHVGGVRSALFNWLWARHNHGTFVLRLEDTDQSRLVAGAAEQINASLEGLGIPPDEGPLQGGEYGPYVQSERLDRYHEFAAKLVASGDLYPCWCTAERLGELRETAHAQGKAFKYDRFCLDKQNQKSLNEPHVLRFRIPETPAKVSWDDAVRGHNEWHSQDLDDFVAIKSDGWPTYHFANVVDDHLMAISHVLRADEWLPSTPKHLLLFEAFGWEPPVYAHLPAILGPDGHKKLSKRDEAKSVSDYLEEGYLPEALISFLATLGWNDGTTQEVFTISELISKFSLDRVQKSPAKFDAERLIWVNGLFIRQLPLQALLERSKSFWPPSARSSSQDYLRAVLGLVQERLKFLGELPDLTEFFFTDPIPDPALLTKQLDATTAQHYLTATKERLADNPWNQAELEVAIRDLADRLGAKVGPYFGLIRVAVTGKTAAPGLFDTLAVLGQAASLRRVDTALETLAANA